MIVRFFGSTNCPNCLEALILFYKYNIDIEYIDAFDEETQELCDENDVDNLPHIQFLKNNTILFEHIGPLSEKELEKYLLTIEEENV